MKQRYQNQTGLIIAQQSLFARTLEDADDNWKHGKHNVLLKRFASYTHPSSTGILVANASSSYRPRYVSDFSRYAYHSYKSSYISISNIVTLILTGFKKNQQF